MPGLQARSPVGDAWKEPHIDVSLSSLLSKNKQTNKMVHAAPGWVAQQVRESSWYTKVAGSIPNQGTYKNQPTNL